MELLAATTILTLLLCSNAESGSLVVPADCNAVEKEAEVALDLINQHRREGYIFSLFRINDAHVQHAGTASIFYLTLDVIETECPVVLRKNWTTCESRPFYGIPEIGQCKAILYLNPLLKKEKLYGYNCTVSKVPPQLYECKTCPVRITIVDDVEPYTGEAEKILEKYNQANNETHSFKVDRVEKVFAAVADNTVHVVEFTIKETNCSRAALQKNPSECEFLPDKFGHVGFCKGRVALKDPDTVEKESCEIYHSHHGRQSVIFRLFFFHHHHHHHDDDSEDQHHHCNVSGHQCKHSSNGPPHRHHHHHHHPSHHHHHHHPPHHHHHHHHHYPHHHHGNGHHQRHRHAPNLPSSAGHYPIGSGVQVSQCNSSDQSLEDDDPGFPPPPGPRYPAPPPGGPHHFPPSRYPPPPAGPPPPHGWPHVSSLPPYGRHHKSNRYGNQRGHRHGCRHNSTSQERGDQSASKQNDLFQVPDPFHDRMVGTIYRTPLLNEHDTLQAPGAEFPDFPRSPQDGHRHPHLPDKHIPEKPKVQPFPKTSSEFKSCPTEPKEKPVPGLLGLYPR